MRKKSSHALVVVGWAERWRNPTQCPNLLGGTAEFVRPPFGLTDDKVIDIYTDLGLEYVY